MDDSKNPETILAFDFGTKRIGVAIGQTITGTASPLEPLYVTDELPNWSKIEELVRVWRPDAIVVGIPYNMDGSEQAITNKARIFMNELEKRINLPIFGMDERLTTIEAKQKLYELGGYKALKEISIDSFAAKIILESWMQSQQSVGSNKRDDERNV